MVNDRKRLEAISELFESEKSYVYEMRLWSTKFRKFLLNCGSISSQRKYALNNIIFLNIEDITHLHENILVEMANNNEKCRVDANKQKTGDIYARIDLKNELNVYIALDYTEILGKYMSRFEMYRYYIERLPKIEFVIDKEIAFNKQFAVELKNFLVETGYGIIGFKHFIFRPSQKLSRYPLLLNAIGKNTENAIVKERIKTINELLMQKTKEYDKILGNVKNAFQLYGMHFTLSFKEHVKKKTALGLFMRDRKLNQISTDVFVLSKYRSEPRPYRIYLTDNMIIVIDVVTLIFGEKLNVVDDPIPLVKYILLDTFHDPTTISYFQERHKFLMKEIDGEDAIYFYFKTEAQCNELRAAIKNAMQLIKDNFINEIELSEFGKIGNNITQMIITDPYYVGHSFSEEEEKRINTFIFDNIKTKKKDELNTKNNNSTAQKNNESTTKSEEKEFIKENIISTKEDIENVSQNELHKNNDESLLEKDDPVFKEETKGFIDVTKHEDNSIDDLNISLSSLDIDDKYSESFEDLNLRNFTAEDEFNDAMNKRRIRDCEIIRKSREVFTNACKEDGDDDEIIFFTDSDGIYMQRKNTIRRIYQKYLKRIIYISQFKILCFIDDDACFWSPIPTTGLIKNLICYKADNIWFGNSLNTPILAVKLISNISTSFLNLFKYESSVFSLISQLFIGAAISQVTFFSTKMMVACVDFEVINMHSLDTYSLLNMNDMFIELIFTHQHPTHAMELFKIEKGKYLVCNDKIGFYINQYGACPPDSAFFVWYNKPTEFKMFNNFIVVLSVEGVVVYNATDGKILRWIIKKNLKFVQCCAGVWVHNENTLFEIILPLR